MSTADMSELEDNETTTAMPCYVKDGGSATASSALSTWQGYIMCAGLTIVAFGVARGSLAVRNLIYQDKVRPYNMNSCESMSTSVWKHNNVTTMSMLSLSLSITISCLLYTSDAADE